MKKVNNWVDKYILNIILGFLFLQPFLDVMTSLSIHVLKLPITVGIIVRVLFLIFLLYYFIFIKPKSNIKRTFWYLCGVLIYMVIYMGLMIYIKDTSVIMTEIQGLMRTFYLPIILVLFIVIYKEKKGIFNNRNYIIIMTIYMLFIIIPTLFNLGFDSYTQGKVGELGWFNSTNEISAILSILLPFSGIWICSKNLNKEEIMKKIIFILLVLCSFFMLGTKMTVISLAVVISIFLLIKFIKLFREKRYKIITSFITIILLFSVGGLILIPKTSFYKNIIIHLNFLGVTSPIEVITDYKVLDHLVFSQRLTFLSNTNSSYSKASIAEKLIGIGYIENYGEINQSTKMIEMDYFDVFYRHGVIGFTIFMIPGGYLLFEINRNRKKKRNLKIEDIAFLISLFIIIVMSLLTGHVLVAPAVSIFVAIILVRQNQLEQEEL